MANIPSQEKRIYRSERERLENRRRTSTVKTHFRRLAGMRSSPGTARRPSASTGKLVSMIDKAAEHGAIHRNNAARKKARAARIRTGWPEKRRQRLGRASAVSAVPASRLAAPRTA